MRMGGKKLKAIQKNFGIYQLIARFLREIDEWT